MKEKYIDYHHPACSKNSFNHRDCVINPERTLIYLKNEFYLITYHTCAFYDKIGTAKKIIETLVKNMKLFETYDIYRGYEVERDIREFRIRNKNLRKKVLEVNYIYANCTRKEWAIGTEVDFFDALCNNDLIDSNYDKASKYLEDNQYDWLQKDLKKLWIANSYYLSEYESYKTIDHLIKSINIITA